MESKKVMTVAAMAMVLIILLSANMDTAGVAAQGLNCYDNCNTGCAGLSSEEYLRCDKECRERCKDEAKEYLRCDNKCRKKCGGQGNSKLVWYYK
ncbi:putative protein isoform X1 [Capsicum chacoense]